MQQSGASLETDVWPLRRGLWAPSSVRLSERQCGRPQRADKILRLDGNNVRWQPVVGKASVSYLCHRHPVHGFSGARNCQKPTAPDELLAASALTISTFRDEVAAAFAMWQAVADIHFREAESPAEADIVLVRSGPDGAMPLRTCFTMPHRASG